IVNLQAMWRARRLQFSSAEGKRLRGIRGARAAHQVIRASGRRCCEEATRARMEKRLWAGHSADRASFGECACAGCRMGCKGEWRSAVVVHGEMLASCRTCKGPTRHTVLNEESLECTICLRKRDRQDAVAKRIRTTKQQR